MRHFAVHEAIYARRLSEGRAGWDDGAWEQHALRAAMDAWTSRSTALASPARVLELGCGTGALGCELARAGHSVTGIDVSPSAIRFAQACAASRGLSIDFVAADACAWLAQARGFSLIIDAHMLHCLAMPVDRRAVLDGVRNALAGDGEFWCESMLRPPDFRCAPSQRLDELGVLWHRDTGEPASADAVWHAGERWLPTRYLAADADALVEEFRVAGLVLLECEVVPAGSPGEPPDFRGRFRKAGSAPTA